MTELASNNTPMDTLTEEDWTTDYGLGKFDTIAAEKLYTWTLEGRHDRENETGNSTDWDFAAVRFNGDKDVPALWAGAIVSELSDGSVSAMRYETTEALDDSWAYAEDMYAQYVHGGCADGVECEGCNACENA